MDLLKKIESLGVWFIVENGSAEARFNGEIPEEAVLLMKENRDEVRELVLLREKRLREYIDKAISELKQKGIVYIWSSVLNEQVAFIMGQDQANKLKPGTVYYTITELNHLRNTNYEGWKQVHRTKKLFGGVIIDVKGVVQDEKTA